MQRKSASEPNRFTREKRFRRSWRKVTAFLSCFVVLFTLSALTLPGITLTEYTCGLEEHFHADLCYNHKGELTCPQQAHEHTAECEKQISLWQTMEPAEPTGESSPEPSAEPSESDSGLWQSAGDLSDETSEPTGEQTASGPNMVELFSSEDPEFTVQIYAYLNIGKDTSEQTNTGEEWLANMVDTRNTSADGQGGKMPTNVYGNEGASGFVATWQKLYLDPSTLSFQLNKGVPTKIFADKVHQYTMVNTFADVDHLSNNKYYTLDSVWILNDDADPDSIDPNDWTPFAGDLTQAVFTKDASVAQSNPNAILVKQGTVIRLNHNPVAGTFTNETTFWDYDISDGKFYTSSDYTTTYTRQPLGSTGKTVYMLTNAQGINGTQTDLIGSGTRLAFGNMNAGNTDQENLSWTDPEGYTVTPNKANRPDGFAWPKPAYNYGCSFGLVTGLDSNGNLIYASGLQVPFLFGEGDANGKTEHTGWSLEFYRNGDTYTLNKVIDPNGTAVLSGLTQLRRYEENSSPSNNFWPMDFVDYWIDGVASGMAQGHDAVFGEEDYESLRKTVNALGGDKTMPIGDDTDDHNSYFGMEFTVDFKLTSDYVGLLEYAFFGDDDMWVFLSPKGEPEKAILICDIGGVHTSAGSYVDLWDWINTTPGATDVTGESFALNYATDGSVGVREFTLTVFYTERGASGSTCWINFTLPSVTNTTTRQVGNLALTKEVVSPSGDTLTPDEDFQFQLELYKVDAGDSSIMTPLNGTYSLAVYQGNDLVPDAPTTISLSDDEDGVIELRAGQRAVISGIPVGTYYTLIELTRGGYSTTVNGAEGYIVSGEISGVASVASFVNTPGTVLPTTGGFGTSLYIFGGWLLLSGSSLVYHFRRKSRRREDIC